MSHGTSRPQCERRECVGAAERRASGYRESLRWRHSRLEISRAELLERFAFLKEVNALPARIDGVVADTADAIKQIERGRGDVSVDRGVFATPKYRDVGKRPRSRVEPTHDFAPLTGHASCCHKVERSFCPPNRELQPGVDGSSSPAGKHSGMTALAGIGR